MKQIEFRNLKKIKLTLNKKNVATDMKKMFTREANNCLSVHKDFKYLNMN